MPDLSGFSDLSGPAQLLTLSRLYFGKDDAESDIAAGGLLRQGFLRTAAYEAARSGAKTLIIGRKGSGKSAICMTLLRASDSKCTVSLVTPDEISADEIRRFNLPGIAPEQSKALMWRYVLAVQVGKFLVQHARECHGKRLPHAIDAVRCFLRDNAEDEDIGLHNKFWRIIERIKSSISLEAFGAKLSVEVHAPSAGIRASNELELLESRLSQAFLELNCPTDHGHLLLTVDQLEKVWSNDPQSDTMVIGLLLASKHIRATFPRVLCAVFLRTDIYELLQFQDRDKFRGDEMRIDWTPDHLLNLVLMRARASLQVDVDRATLWGALFPENVGWEPTPDFLIARTLMRPRDLIQFSNVCRDTAEKNAHTSISEMDVKEAAIQYSNWKLQDLSNEYYVNYPFLGDLFVLFQSTSYLITRTVLRTKLRAIREALCLRYPGFENVFNTASGVLDILYGIGFVGVIRGDKPVYVYTDPNRIEHHEKRFIVHPCFREALRSMSSVDVRPYEPLTLRRRFRLGQGWGGTSPQVRGTRAHRAMSYVSQLCDNVVDALVLDACLPAEVKDEVRRNVQAIRADSRRARETAQEYEVAERTLAFFQQLMERLETPELLQGDAKNLERVLQYTVDELRQLAVGRGPAFDGYTP
jgi:hypothetical protein